MKTKFTYSISITSLFLGILFIMTGFENAESDKTLKETSSGELNFTVRTVTANGNYAPKHVLAIWVEYENDFVKTRLLRGNARKQYLYTWKAASDYNVVDAITGATLTSHTTHSVTWDCLDLDGNIVPDGEYTIWVEFTEKHAQGPLFSIPFSKGPDAINLTPSDETYFKDIELDFTPFTAEFIASTQEVCQDEELTFTDESVNATEWDWDFGDGASPAAANTEGPHTVSYSTSGFKTVSLTINGSLTETKENYVEILSQPSADFEFGGTFYHIDFMNNSIDANSYTWDFGDGNTSTEENPSHEYALDGSYMVTLHAINSICFDEITYEVQVPMVGVNELREADLINISPNPNSGTFTINKNELGKINSISIRDMVGKETSFSKSESNSIISIDLKKNAPGIYFLMIKTDNKVYSKKFITR